MTTAKTTIEIDIEDLHFLRGLAAEMINQDGVGTADPYFIVLREKCKAYDGHPDYFRARYLDTSSGEYEVFTDKESVLKDLEDEDKWGVIEDKQQFFYENFTKVGERGYDIEHNIFLTHKAFAEHVVRNRHNYGPIYSYVKHAYRNNEIAQLFDILKKFKEV